MKKKIFITLLVFSSIFGYVFYSNNTRQLPNKSAVSEKINKKIEFKNWKIFDSKDEYFSAVFPSKPKKIQKTIPIPGETNTLEYFEYQTIDNEI